MMKSSKTKRFLSVVLSMAMIVTMLTSMWVYSASADPTSGTSVNEAAATAAEPVEADLNGKGTETEPFRITSKEDLEKMRDHVNAQDRFILDTGDEAYANAYYELTADIVLDNSTNWNPIGRGSNGISSAYAFSGTFDGKGHTISGLYFKSNSNYYTFGLFGYNSGTIKNLFVKDCNITGYFWNGVIAGINYGTIENCLTSGTIDGAFNNGGITGINRGGTIKNCLSTASAPNHDATNGIYGSSYDRVESGDTIPATIENNYYIDSVAGINVAGKVEPVSQTDLESGKITWLLQNGQSADGLVWEQDLGSDTIPQLHSADDGDNYAVHHVTFYFYNTDTVVYDAYVNEGIIAAPDVTVDVDGYTVGGKWFADKDDVSGEANAWDFASNAVDADKEFYSNRKAIEYTITYNLGEGGSWSEEPQEGKSHPDHYTVEDANIVLAEPVRDGYTFIGWTGTGITGSAESVIIETGSTGDRVYNAQYYDDENPTASIEVGGDTWTYLDSYIEFDTFFNTSQTVTITAEDNDDTDVDVWYYIANSPVEDITSDDIAWVAYDGENKPVISPEGQFVIYAKAQDDTGHIGYTSTSGIVLEVTPPVISDVTDGATYCLFAAFRVEDENLESVTANDKALTAAEDGITYTINENGTYTITATDKAGNTTAVSITVADHHEGEIRTENVREAGCENDGLDIIKYYCSNCFALIKSEEKVLNAFGHTWGEWATVKSAGCEDDGVKQHTCQTCKLTVSENVNHTGHEWGETKDVIREASCTQEGLRAYRCQKCDATYEEEIITKLPHDNRITTTENVVPATCTQDGSYVTVIRCSMCQQETNRIPGTLQSPGHKWSEWTVKDAPNCEDSGMYIRTCSVCSTTETKNINPNGHAWATEPEVDQKATCTVDGSMSIHCTVCGVSKPDSSVVIKAEGHKPADQKIIKNYEPATCEHNGSYEEITVCSVCNEEIEKEYKTEFMKDHEWSDWYEFTSGVCGGDTGERRDCKNCRLSETRNMNKLAHAWNVDANGEYVYTVDAEPTCTTQGSQSVHCTRSGCVAILMSETLEAKGHDWSDWSVVKSPDCDDSGTKMRTCERCKITETEGLNPNGHAWNVDADGEYVYTVDSAASCTTDGSKSVHCKNCDTRINSQVIPAYGHTFSDWTITDSPECEDDGTAQRVCQECGYTESENINATGHVWETDEDGNEVYTVDLAPSCTTDGSKSIHCIKCNAKKDSISIPMVDHTWSAWETVEMPDCDDEGTQQRTCSVCGAIDTLGLDPTGHEWPLDENGETVYTIVEATCTSDGSKSVLCARCGVALESEVIKAEGHKPADTKLIVDSTPATCESDGGYYEATVCSVCGVEITRSFVVVNSTGHDWGDWYPFTSDTCGGDTGERRDCKICQVSETRNIDPLAHAWNVDENGEYVYTVDFEPTCTMQGSQSVHCTRNGCVAILMSETIEAKGHDWSVVKSPDCDDSGTKIRTCERCKITETEGLNPNGHTWNVDADGEYVYTVDSAASCTTDGSKSVHCKNCDARINSQVIPAYGHTFSDWTITDSPECEDDGTAQRVCQECGYTESENINATGHVWETDEDGNEVYTVDLEPSCTTDGSKSIHCTKCDAKKDSIAIPMVDHTWSAWETVEMPDCDDEGTLQRTCEVCGAIDTLGLDPTGHEWPTDENGETVYTIVEATCTSDGSKSVLCARCGVALESEVIPALGHDFVDGICSRCGVGDGTMEKPEIILEGTDEIFTIGLDTSASIHCSADRQWFVSVAVDGEIVDEKYYTVSEGSTIITFSSEYLDTLEPGMYTVTLNFTYGSVDTILFVTVHEHIWNDGGSVIEWPTCTQPGKRGIFCGICGVMQDTVIEIPALGHTPAEEPTVIKAPTCTQAGEQVYYCTVCGEMIEDSLEELPALGHSFGDWHTIDAPNCENKGGEMRECSVCGFTETRDIDALGHDWADAYTVDVEAGCLTDGSKSIHCNRCDAVKDSTVIPARGAHEIEIVGAKAATCTEEGYTGDQICSVCGEIVAKGETIAAKGHNFVNGVCSVCGATQTAPITGGEYVILALLFAVMIAGFGFFMIVIKRRKELQK